MPTPNTKSLDEITHILLIGLVLAACLILVGGAAIAGEQDEDTEVIVESPVVVVRGHTDHPDFTWTVAGSRAFLGVQTLELTPELREHFGVPPEAGVLVSRIVEESPAAASDIQVGDIISAVDGEEIVSPSALARAIGHRESGEAIDLEIWRSGNLHQVQSSLTEREGPYVDIRQFHRPEGQVRTWTWSDTDLEGAIELETETLNQAIERLNEEMDSPEWHERLHSFRDHQGTLMKRIEILEKRLKELEQELGQLGDEE